MVYIKNPAFPSAIICDIDGTIALRGDSRSPYDYSRVLADRPNTPIIDLVRMLGENTHLIFVSGRDDSCREDTKQWLVDHLDIPYPDNVELYMRKTGDNRKDAIVKQEIFETHIAPAWNVLYVLDDRNQVVDMWRALGLTVLQVADGDY